MFNDQSAITKRSFPEIKSAHMGFFFEAWAFSVKFALQIRNRNK